MTTISEELKHTFFMLVKTTATWLQISPKERFEFLEKMILPILKTHPSVQMRFFDSEAFSGRFTDVLMWETVEIQEYQFLVEKLRETLFWGTYFEIVEIVPAIENAYASYYKVDPISVSQSS
ncbi:darcynin family protein [Richelia sinica]|nr:darcynin family protein [Richelia sinica]MBD2665804.1 darcynin [Richelia sinica FACHB-800]